MDEDKVGYWWYPGGDGARLAGLLSLDPPRAPRLTLVEDIDADAAWLEDWPELYQKPIPMLHGYAEGLGYHTLLNVWVSGMSMAAARSYRFVARTVIDGVLLSRPDQKHFRMIEVHSPNLGELLGSDWPRLGESLMTQDKVDVSSETPKRSWTSRDIEVAVSLNWTVSGWGRSAETRTSYRPLATFTSPRPKSLQYWFEEWLVPFNNLLRVATGTNSRFTSMRTWHKKHLSPRERHDEAMSVHAPGVGSHDFDVKEASVIRRLRLDAPSEDDLPVAVERARALEQNHVVFHSRLAEVLNDPNRPRENRYLDLMGATEAMHGGLYSLEPISRSEFEKRRRRARAELETRDSRHFFDSWMPRRSSTSLEQQIAALCDRITFDRSSWAITPAAMARLRNDLAHGNRSADLSILPAALDQALDLCRQLYLDESGFPDD